MTSSHRLPVELFDLILNELNPQISTELDNNEPLSNPALGSCLFVSKFIRHLALSKIFNHTKFLHKPQEPKKGQQRLALLRQILTPPAGSVLESVRPHIKALSCIFQRPAWNADAKQFMGDVDENLAFVIKTMSEGDCCVTHFAFKMSAPIRWSLLNPDLQDALQRLIRSPNLVSLDIRGIKYLPTDLMVGAHLSDLRLQQFPDYQEGPEKWTALTSDPQYSRLDCPPLESLHTDHSYQYLDSKLANLKKLVVHNDVAEDFANTQDIIQASADTLEHVSIEHSGIGQANLPATFRIDHVSNLKTFSHLRFRDFYWNYPFTSLPAQPILEVFSRLLDARSPMSFLVRIKLEFYFHEIIAKEDFLHPSTDFAEWDRFDALLCGPRYPSLEKVSIVIHAHLWLRASEASAFDVDTFSSSTTGRIRACLPKLDMDKDLAVKITAEVHAE
ncbi:hypothetical protein GALMADRAFT_207857 [Galerina marginata CBS 339.88]|uniref:F-box domain-containing protein n=1 Tax=Galerina marginata (strain CBS 339.88) TaxID=685588 RepID=A0A067TPS4_GALM3|nr:hypothetical protein GALMADRAFT_207857 [Galerina marginata CBS 339.88]